MDVWSILLIVAVGSVLIAILIHKVAKWSGRTEGVSVYLLPLGLLLTPVSLILGTFKDNRIVQIATLCIFFLLIVLCFMRLYGSGHTKQKGAGCCTCCGAAIQKEMRFCPSCGREINRRGGK